MKKQNNILSDDYEFYIPKKPKIRNFKSKQISSLELDNEESHYQFHKKQKYANKNY